MNTEEYESVLECIRASFGESTDITGKTYVSGGDINEAAALSLSNGERVFMKSNTMARKDFFSAEEKGLWAIAGTGAIGTPKLIGRGTDKQLGISFLMMECIESGRRAADFWEDFGQKLAMMHLTDTSAYTDGKRFGFLQDNFIGATKQINDTRDDWITFFAECRLEPQFKMAERYFDGARRKRILSLLDKLPVYLDEPSKPSLIHGDLWSGNFLVGQDGKAMLIDPAVYVGHFEAELAMTELFGGFPRSFYEAYSDVNPVRPGYRDRKKLYNLYHLLNHLNLFGPGYLSGVADTIQRFG